MNLKASLKPRYSRAKFSRRCASQPLLSSGASKAGALRQRAYEMVGRTLHVSKHLTSSKAPAGGGRAPANCIYTGCPVPCIRFHGVRGGLLAANADEPKKIIRPAKNREDKNEILERARQVHQLEEMVNEVVKTTGVAAEVSTVKVLKRFTYA
jgi:hypothetical protein